MFDFWKQVLYSIPTEKNTHFLLLPLDPGEIIIELREGGILWQGDGPLGVLGC